MNGRIVFYHADWCGPCKSMDPELRQLCRELAFEFIDINGSTEEGAQQAEYDRVGSYPTVDIYNKENELTFRLVGARAKSVYSKMMFSANV